MIGEIAVLGYSIWPVVKIMFLIAVAIYIIFAAVVVRQVQLMTDTLEVGFETPVRILAVLHFLLAIGAFILAYIVL